MPIRDHVKPLGPYFGLIALALTTVGVAPTAAAAERGPFVPTSNLGFDDLVKAVSRAQEVIASAREVQVRVAALEQSTLWNNPVVDAIWATIPIGRTNPSNVERPLTKIPSYHVGVSYSFPFIWKRPTPRAPCPQSRVT